jgi:hypothetical protein
VRVSKDIEFAEIFEIIDLLDINEIYLKKI